MLFSIITVTHNNEDGLRRTKESVEAQTLSAYEWIVIDGGSADGTAALLENSAAQWISEPDEGIYDAMNKGIEKAEGFFVVFLNAGDVFASKTTLEELAAYIQDLQETPEFIYGDALEQRPGRASAYKSARAYTKKARGMFTHHQAMIYRRDMIDDLRYDQAYEIAADYKFTLQYLARCETVIYAPFPLCLFESGGISQRKATQGRREQFKIRQELRTTSPLQNRLITARQALAWQFRMLSPALYWKLKSAR